MPVGYWGVSMGTLLGLPFVAADPRVRACVLGLAGLHRADRPTRLVADAARVEVPDAFLVQLDDELFPTDAVARAVRARSGATDKRLFASPGRHRDVPADAFWLSVDFLATHLELVGGWHAARRRSDAAPARARRCPCATCSTSSSPTTEPARPSTTSWFHRLGRYDRGAAATAAWREEVGEVRAVARRRSPSTVRDVLELAPGTGHLDRRAALARGASVTAVDAAPEMLAELHAGRIGHPRSRRSRRTCSRGQPPRRFDAVVSCFFMSHVPDERFGAFLELVAGALRDGGSLLPSRRRSASRRSTAGDHVLPDERRQTMRRLARRRARVRIVKRFRTPDELVAAFAAHDVDLVVRHTEHYFQVASGTRR